MNTETLTHRIIIPASTEVVFKYVANWEKQSDWIMFTTVKNLSKPLQGKDVTLLAVTKIGPFKIERYDDN